MTPWVGLVPACQMVWEATLAPGYPGDEFVCPTPACLLVAYGPGGDEEALVCAECALHDGMTIVRALDHVDFACHVLGIVDAAMMELDAKQLMAALYGVLAVGPYQLDQPYIAGWNAIIGLRTAHLESYS